MHFLFFSWILWYYRCEKLMKKGDAYYMVAMPFRKVNREQIYREIVKMIEQSPEREVEISSSDLADQFGVQAPTMDYHLNKLVEEGYLSLSPKRGRYKRKIYRLPHQAHEHITENIKEKKEKPKIELHDTFTPESAERFREFLEKHIKKDKKEEKGNQTVAEEIETREENKNEDISSKEIHSIDAGFSLTKNKIEEPIQVKELTLDEKIERFLQQANQVHDAQELLRHEDREILSVMNETIHQTVVYLKDLSEQLSTVQNKELIQHLIDDRNRMQQKVQRLEQELDETRMQLNQTVKQYELDPNRIRFMHQLIIDTIDDYINRPNHALALGRTEFREKVSKEISDLVKYVLHLEK